MTEPTLEPLEALERIHALLDGTYWDCDTAVNIAAVVRSTGRVIREPPEGDTVCRECSTTFPAPHDGKCPSCSSRYIAATT